MFLIFTDMTFLQEGNDMSSPNGAGARTPFQDISNTHCSGNYQKPLSAFFHFCSKLSFFTFVNVRINASREVHEQQVLVAPKQPYSNQINDSR